jgi:hypothetical protein
MALKLMSDGNYVDPSTVIYIGNVHRDRFPSGLVYYQFFTKIAGDNLYTSHRYKSKNESTDYEDKSNYCEDAKGEAEKFREEFIKLTQKHNPTFGGKEYIVCSAAMYKGVMVTGRRHGDCNELLEKLLGLTEDQTPDREDQGFMTSKGRYVNRHEAYLIARENNQLLLEHVDGVTEELISENLY